MAAVAANVAVYGLWQLPEMRSFMTTHFTTSYSHLATGRLHTLLTHAVSHVSLNHLAANMITFYFFAPELAALLGGIRVRTQPFSSLPGAGCALPRKHTYFDRG